MYVQWDPTLLLFFVAAPLTRGCRFKASIVGVKKSSSLLRSIFTTLGKHSWPQIQSNDHLL